MAVQQRHEIPRDECTRFLDLVTDAHAGQDLTIEVLDREYGEGDETAQLPLAYIEYDHWADEVAVAVGGRDGRYPVVLRHTVQRSRRILADGAAPFIEWAFDIVAADDSHTIVTIIGRPEPRSE